MAHGLAPLPHSRGSQINLSYVVNINERIDLLVETSALDDLAWIQEAQFQHEGEANDLGTRKSAEPCGCNCGSGCGDQVIHDQNAIVRRKGVLMHLKNIDTILE